MTRNFIDSYELVSVIGRILPMVGFIKFISVKCCTAPS